MLHILHLYMIKSKNMKLLHFSDIHIGMENYAKLDPETGLSTRLLDFLKTFDFIVDTAIDNVWVSRKPEKLEIPTKSGNLQVITLPWLHKDQYKSVGDKLKSLYDKIK